MISILLALFVVTGGDRVAVVDPYANEVRIDGGSPIATRETPVDALFLGTALYVVERDSQTLARFDGKRAEVALARDPAFVREAGGRLLVYSRLEGVVQEIDPSAMRVTRTVRMAPFASDFEVDGRSGYLVYPRDAKVRTFDLATLKETGEVAVGAVPVDATIQKRATALSPATLAVADPSSKRVWVVEGRQSATAAFARGFVRGFLGLGLFRGRNAEFPTGVDRVVAAHGRTVAYDSSSGTLYEIAKSKSRPIATGVRPGTYVVTANGVSVWQNRTLKLIR